MNHDEESSSHHQELKREETSKLFHTSIASSLQSLLAGMPQQHPSEEVDDLPHLPQDAKRRFARTNELYSRAITLWDDLEHRIQCSGKTLDDWIAAAHQMGDLHGKAHAARLQSIKDHMGHIKQIKKLEKPRPAHFNKISPTRLVNRV